MKSGSSPQMGPDFHGESRRFKEDVQESPLYYADHFRVSCFKVLPCSKRYCHDWTQCPFAHPGEKAKRRDVRAYNYCPVACPDMKKVGLCPRGDACSYAHNIFEIYLHPDKYRTQLCNDGSNCHRKVCFFAHSLDELRTPGAGFRAAMPESGAAMLADTFGALGVSTPAHGGSREQLAAVTEMFGLQQQQQQQQPQLSSPMSTLAPHDAFDSGSCSNGSMSPPGRAASLAAVRQQLGGGGGGAAPLGVMLGDPCGGAGASVHGDAMSQHWAAAQHMGALASQLAGMQAELGAGGDPGVAGLLNLLLQEVRCSSVQHTQAAVATAGARMAPPVRMTSLPPLQQHQPLDGGMGLRRCLSIETPQQQPDVSLSAVMAKDCSGMTGMMSSPASGGAGDTSFLGALLAHHQQQQQAAAAAGVSAGSYGMMSEPLPTLSGSVALCPDGPLSSAFSAYY